MSDQSHPTLLRGGASGCHVSGPEAKRCLAYGAFLFLSNDISLTGVSSLIYVVPVVIVGLLVLVPAAWKRVLSHHVTPVRASPTYTVKKKKKKTTALSLKLRSFGTAQANFPIIKPSSTTPTA